MKRWAALATAGAKTAGTKSGTALPPSASKSASSREEWAFSV
ncbi:MAG TPA: hypothetical protein VES79_06715 [Solirubrobacteraceae bacterium]|nr:hypothetical protein [Solirubrobacteraceae bacterium]